MHIIMIITNNKGNKRFREPLKRMFTYENAAYNIERTFEENSS